MAFECKRVAGRPIMADTDPNPVVSIDPQYLRTAEVVERAPSERSKHDTIDTILDWLADPVRNMPTLVGGVDEFAWRLLAARFPLFASTLHIRTLPPQYLRVNLVLWP